MRFPCARGCPRIKTSLFEPEQSARSRSYISAKSPSFKLKSIMQTGQKRCFAASNLASQKYKRRACGANEARCFLRRQRLSRRQINKYWLDGRVADPPPRLRHGASTRLLKRRTHSNSPQIPSNSLSMYVFKLTKT